MPEEPEPRLRELLREVAAADADELVQEARAAARARVKAMLENALVDELLAAVGRREQRTEDEAVPPAKSSSSAPTGDAWWVYCVVPSDQAPAASELQGIEPGTAVEVVAEGELAALVSPVPLAEYDDERLRAHLEDIEWLERTARAHEAVLEHVLHRTAMVPLRLCTLYRDRDGIQRMLRQHASALAASLTALAGATEWGVQVFLEDDQVPSAPPPEGETAEEPVSGAGYLAKRQRERQATRQRDEICQECVEEVHGAVSEIVTDARLNPVQRPEAHGRHAEMLLNGAYLVSQDQVGELSRTIALLQGRWGPRGFAVEMTGPWPPYNFVSEAAGMIS